MRKAKANSWKVKFIGTILGLYIRFVFFTSRKTIVGREIPEAYFKDGRRFIVAAWHNRNLQSAMGFQAIRPKDRHLCVIASESRDGELAARGLAVAGVKSARGSSTRGGSQALLKMVRLLKKGMDLGITPDGPKGPIYQVQPGVLFLSRLGQVDILPMSWDSSFKKELRTWDGLLIPFPFGHLRFAWGEPVSVPKSAKESDLEIYSEKLRKELNRVQEVVSDFGS